MPQVSALSGVVNNTGKRKVTQAMSDGKRATPTKSSKGSVIAPTPAGLSTRASGASDRGLGKSSDSAAGAVAFSLDAGDAQRATETLEQLVHRVLSKGYSPGREIRGVPTSAGKPARKRLNPKRIARFFF